MAAEKPEQSGLPPEKQAPNPETRFTDEHEWVLLEGGIAKVGISDFAQQELGDVVYVKLPNVDEQVQQKQAFGEVESVKTVSDIYSPVTGVVIEVNSSLLESPELVNSDPYGKGWIIKVRITNPQELESLKTPEAYSAFLQGTTR